MSKIGETRNGIIYDLSKSHYFVELNGVVDVFSSMLSVRKFKERYGCHRADLSKRFNYHFGVESVIFTLSDLILYKSIEKRGCLIKIGGEDICHPIIKLNGTIQNKRY